MAEKTISDYLLDIQLSKGTIVNKTVEMKLPGATGTDSLAEAAQHIDQINVCTATSISVPHGQTKKLDAGYYPSDVILNGDPGSDDNITVINNGSLTVTSNEIPAPGSQSKTYQANQQNGENGLPLTGYSTVTIQPIPSKYKDTTNIVGNVSASDIISGKKYIKNDFTLGTGSLLLEDNHTKTVTTGQIEILPTNGYTAMKKVTVTGPTSSTTITDQTIDGFDTNNYVKTVNSGYLASNRTVTFDPTSIINALAAI